MLTGGNQIKTRSDVMIARGTCHATLAVVRSFLLATSLATAPATKVVERNRSANKNPDTQTTTSGKKMLLIVTTFPLLIVILLCRHSSRD